MIANPLSPSALAMKTKTPASISTMGKGFDIAASGGSVRGGGGDGKGPLPAAGLGLASDRVFQQRGESKKNREQDAVDLYEGIALVDSVLEDAEVQRRLDAKERSARFKNRVGKIGSTAKAAAPKESNKASPPISPKSIPAIATSSAAAAVQGGRGGTVQSSPRVNPMLLVKVAVESASSKMDHFLYSTASEHKALEPLVHANLSAAETRARKRREMVERRNKELAELRLRELVELAGEGPTSEGTPADASSAAFSALNVTSATFNSNEPYPAKERPTPSPKPTSTLDALVDQSHLIHLGAAALAEVTADTIDGQSPIRSLGPKRGYASDDSHMTSKDAMLKTARDQVLTSVLAQAAKRHHAFSSSVGGKRRAAAATNTATHPSRRRSGFVPGSSLAGLVECKESLSRSNVLESRRRFTSSFGAPPRPALLRQTCAPAHASYQVKYTEVERRPTGSIIVPVGNTLSKMRQRLANAAAVSSILQPAASEPSAASITVQSPASSPSQGTGFFLTSTGHTHIDGANALGATSKIDRTVSFRSERSGLDATQGGLADTTTTKGNIVPGSSPHDDARAKAAHAMHNTTVPDPSLLTLERDLSDFQRRDEKSYAASFKSLVKREFSPTSLDLSYYPLVEPGITTYGPGRIVGNAREREYTPYGRPCGANTTYNLDLIDEAQRKRDTERKTINFSKGISRDQFSAFSGVGGVDTSQLSYKDQKSAVLNRQPKGAYVAMDKLTGRPGTQRAATTEPPEMSKMDNTMATSTKKGFVDFSRSTNYPTRSLTYFDEMRERDTRPPLDVSDAFVSRQGPAVSFSKGSMRPSLAEPMPRAHSSMASLGGVAPRSTSPYYLDTSSRVAPSASIVELKEGYRNHLDGIGAEHVSPVHRRPPVVVFPLTSRETAPISRTPVPGDYTKGTTASSYPARHTVYDVKETRHVPAASFGPLVSREQREKALTHRYASTDAVYDTIPRDKPKLVLGFDKVPPRK